MQPLDDVLQVQSDWGSAKLDSKSYSKETANEKWKWEIEVLSCRTLECIAMGEDVSVQLNPTRESWDNKNS